VKTESLPLALRDFAAQVGREDSLSVVHGAVLRAAHAIRPVVESGALLAACSDEFNGEVRAAFERDVACMLTAPNIPGKRRVFSVSNLGGRIEPGAIALANLHFTALSQQAGEKLLLIEIASHVGRREGAQGATWGELDRFGTTSPCCGALQLLLDVPAGAEAVRFPWFDQLNAFFGAERLGALRSDTSPYRMLRAAIVHAVLQAETAIVDLLREPPGTSTQVLLVALVVVNRRGTDNAIPVGLHRLRFEGGAAEFVFGTSLRSTPASIVVDAAQSCLRVSSSTPEAPRAAAPILRLEAHGIPPRVRELAAAPAVRAQLESGRRQLRAMHAHPSALRIYSRPLLRALLQGLSIAAPELALTALALESGHEFFRAMHVRRLIEHGPSTAEARKAIHDFEPMLQQLGHQQAREVLETLLAETHPVLGR